MTYNKDQWIESFERLAGEHPRQVIASHTLPTNKERPASTPSLACEGQRAPS